VIRGVGRGARGRWGWFGAVAVGDGGHAKKLSEASRERERPEPNEVAEWYGLLAAACEPDRHTQPGTVLGALPYMPPEQARGEVALLDPRCDVFNLGAILCEILTGEPPYRAGSRE